MSQIIRVKPLNFNLFRFLVGSVALAAHTHTHHRLFFCSASAKYTLCLTILCSLCSPHHLRTRSRSNFQLLFRCWICHCCGIAIVFARSHFMYKLHYLRIWSLIHGNTVCVLAVQCGPQTSCIYTSIHLHDMNSLRVAY